MISRNSPSGFVLACAISVFAGALAGTRGADGGKVAGNRPSGSGDAVQWQSWTRDLGWRVMSPEAPAIVERRPTGIALAGRLRPHRKREADPARVYLAGRGDAAAAIFYAISRVPDLWAAGVAVGGSPKPAIDTDRVFAANFGDARVLGERRRR